VGFRSIIWDLEDDAGGNVQRIEEHGIDRLEVEDVLHNPIGVTESRSSGFPIAFGETRAGRTIAVVFELIDGDTAYPITAYEVEL
jgi:hypothetical protein